MIRWQSDYARQLGRTLAQARQALYTAQARMGGACRTLDALDGAAIDRCGEQLERLLRRERAALERLENLERALARCDAMMCDTERGLQLDSERLETGSLARQAWASPPPGAPTWDTPFAWYPLDAASLPELAYERTEAPLAPLEAVPDTLRET